MKEHFRTVLFVVALGMVWMNIQENGLQWGNALIGVMLIAVFGVSFYFKRKQAREAKKLIRQQEAEKKARRRARKAAQKSTKKH